MLELQYYMPDTLLYYRTIQHFIFFWFFFYTIHKHKYRGNMIVLSARIGRRGRKCMSEISMENACGINSIVKRGMLHAPKERKRISKVQDSLVFQKRLQLRGHDSRCARILDKSSSLRLGSASWACRKMMSLLIS